MCHTFLSKTLPPYPLLAKARLKCDEIAPDYTGSPVTEIDEKICDEVKDDDYRLIQ